MLLSTHINHIGDKQRTQQDEWNASSLNQNKYVSISLIDNDTYNKILQIKTELHIQQKENRSLLNRI